MIADWRYLYNFQKEPEEKVYFKMESKDKSVKGQDPVAGHKLCWRSKQYTLTPLPRP